MELEFVDGQYHRLETDAAETLGLDPALVKAFRMRIQGLRAATDVRDIYAMKSWRFEKLKGKRDHQRSLRLNDQFRLILEIVEDEEGTRLLIIGIEDYH